MCEKCKNLDDQILTCCDELCNNCPAVLVKSICDKIDLLNSKLFNYYNQIKSQKLTQLLGTCANTSSNFILGNQNTVVTILENMSLSDPKKSVLNRSETSEKEAFETLKVDSPRGSICFLRLFCDKMLQ